MIIYNICHSFLFGLPMESEQITEKNQRISQQHAINRIQYEWTNVPKDLINDPSPRYGHISFVYKSRFYVFGGSSIDQSRNSLQHIYFYCLETKKWIKTAIKISPNKCQSIQLTNGSVIGNRLYVIGYLNSDFSQKSFMWKLNLDSLDWTEVDQKGEIPPVSQLGCFITYDKNWLVLYGGQNPKQDANYNSFYLYNKDTNVWFHCKGNYQYIVKSRVKSSMVGVNGKIYLFGGYYNGVGGQYLNDFYEISFRLPSKNIRAQALMRRISTPSSPTPRADHLLFAVSNCDVCLLGGKNSQEEFKQIWHFSCEDEQWTLLQSVRGRQFIRDGSASAQEGDNIWIFGGLTNFNIEDSIVEFSNELTKLHINWRSFYEEQPQNKDRKHSKVSYQPTCKLCFQRRFSFSHYDLTFSSPVEDIVEFIECPFAAIGLIIDNSLILGASHITITVQGKEGEHYLRIEDNGKVSWAEEEFIQSIVDFKYQNYIISSGCDKKTKKYASKENTIRQFGSNLKLGCLRLGQKFLWVSNTGTVVHVIYCQRIKQKNHIIDYLYGQEDTTDSQTFTYKVYYYSINSASKQLIRGDMAFSRNYIQTQYKEYVHQVVYSKINKNVVFIFKTILDNPDEDISIQIQDNDIFYGASQKISHLHSQGHNIRECIDISLRAYLSSLYLRCESLEIFLGISRTIASICFQNYLEKVDKMCKSGTAIQLEDIIDFDFKLAQFYYLKELSTIYSIVERCNNFFCNGVLLYYRNRLVTRYKVDIGSLLNHIEESGYAKQFSLFGYAQLPEGVLVNPFKTDFSFSLMLERIYSRFKFVEEGFRKKIMSLSTFQLRYSPHQRRQNILQNSGTPTKQLPRRLRTPISISFRQQAYMLQRYKQGRLKERVESQEGDSIQLSSQRYKHGKPLPRCAKQIQKQQKEQIDQIINENDKLIKKQFKEQAILQMSE